MKARNFTAELANPSRIKQPNQQYTKEFLNLYFAELSLIESKRSKLSLDLLNSEQSGSILALGLLRISANPKLSQQEKPLGQGTFSLDKGAQSVAKAPKLDGSEPQSIHQTEAWRSAIVLAATART